MTSFKKFRILVLLGIRLMGLKRIGKVEKFSVKNLNMYVKTYSEKSELWYSWNGTTVYEKSLYLILLPCCQMTYQYDIKWIG